MSTIKTNTIKNVAGTREISTELLTGLNTQFSHRNKIINGNFDVWQRGTSVGDGSTVLNDEFLADRWLCDDGVGGNYILSRRSFSIGTTSVPNNPKYFHRLDFPTTAPTSGAVMRQKIEGASTLSGKQVTVSFYVYGTMGGTFNVNLKQSFGTGGSPSGIVSIPLTSFTLSGSFTRYEATVTVPSISGKTLGTDGNDSLWLNFDIPSNELGQFNVAQVQLEEGSVATPFEQRPIALELAMCQRYYSTSYVVGGGATAYTTANVWSPSIFFPQSMRVVPTITWANVRIFTSTWTDPSAITAGSPKLNCFYFSCTIAGVLDQDSYLYQGDWYADAEL